MAHACARRADAHADRRAGLFAVGAAVKLWADFKHMAVQTFISLDQTANVLLSWLSPWAWRGAWADETLSCRCYRAWRDGAVMGRVFMPPIDWVFRVIFRQKLPPGAIGHCHGAYIKERAKYNHPPEMR